MTRQKKKCSSTSLRSKRFRVVSEQGTRKSEEREWKTLQKMGRKFWKETSISKNAIQYPALQAYAHYHDCLAQWNKQKNRSTHKTEQCVGHVALVI